MSENHSNNETELNIKLAELKERQAELLPDIRNMLVYHDNPIISSSANRYITDPTLLVNSDFIESDAIHVNFSKEDAKTLIEFATNVHDMKTIVEQLRLFQEAQDARAGQIISSRAKQEISQARPENIQEVFAGQLGAIEAYYSTALSQSDRSFKWALIATGIGLILFVAAIVFLLLQSPSEVAIVSVIGGTIIEFIAGVNFYLYSKTSQQLSEFRAGLERTSHYLLANSVALNIGDTSAQADAMKNLVLLVADGKLLETNPPVD